MRVAVVGAGVAGLAAARALVDRRHEVTVFERSPVAGGRVGTKAIKTIELPRGMSGEVAFDHGAQYFTVRDDRFSALAAEWDRDRVISKWTGMIVVFDDEGWEKVEDGTSRYVGIPDMSAISKAMAAGLNISYGQRIESIDPLLAEFDHVILAIPAAAALRLVSHQRALSAKIAGVSMPPTWTVMAAFEERVVCRFDAAFVTGNAISWIARNSSKPKRNWQIETWVIHASHAWSQAHFDDQPDDVGAFLMATFEDLIPAGLPRAFYATVHRWRHAAADPPLAAGAIHDSEARITLCGDWCKGPRVEDAYVSGIEAATLIPDP